MQFGLHKKWKRKFSISKITELIEPITRFFAPVAGSIGTTRYYVIAILLENEETLIPGGYLSSSQTRMVVDLSACLYKP